MTYLIPEDIAETIIAGELLSLLETWTYEITGDNSFFNHKQNGVISSFGIDDSTFYSCS